MTEENGKVCCNCRHNIRTGEKNNIECHCDIDGSWLSYTTVMTYSCKYWSRDRAERENIFVDVYELFEVDNSFHDAVICLAYSFGIGIAKVLECLNNCVNAFSSVAEEAARSFELYAESFKNLAELEGVRPPSIIKKELKHEKNPMRIKQLNRELTESYKKHSRK